MVEFAGWNMPITYRDGVKSEVNSCRHSIGLFDVSHMGELNITGSQCWDFLQYLTANDIAKIRPGQAQYSLLLNQKGCVIDDIIVYCYSSNQYMIVVNAGCHRKDLNWILEQASKYDVVVQDISSETALIAVQGPAAYAAITSRTPTQISHLNRFEFVTGRLFDSTILFSRTGYTGEDGFELFIPWDEAPRVWNQLIDIGAVPCGLAARDILRLEAAYPLYGHELDADHTPFESGAGWAVKLKKGNFIGSETLTKKRAEPLKKKLVALKTVNPANSIPREKLSVQLEGREIGIVTSGTLSPTVECGIALARVDAEFSTVGLNVQIDIRGRLQDAVICQTPFYRNGV